MTPLLSDSQFNSLALVLIAIVGIIPATLAAYWSRSARKESQEANANSAEAKENSASALHEVQTNGGMSDPKPNLNDHVKYQTEMTEWLVRTVNSIDKRFCDHLEHSQLMDQALAEVYMKVRPDSAEWPNDDLPPSPPT